MVKIISDSTCDLSPELIAKYDIDIQPLHILLGEDEYEDGRNITPQQIYDWSDAHKTTPKTSAPSLAAAIELQYSRSVRVLCPLEETEGLLTPGDEAVCGEEMM